MDYYTRLGVDKKASPEELKRAYKKLAMQHHPDRGGDQKTFQEINEAYDTLKDPAKRQQYDNPQPRADFNMNSQNMNDIFSQFFGGGMQQRVRRNRDVTINVRVSLQDVMTGKDVVGKYRLNSGREEVANIKIPAGVEDNLIMQYRGLGDDIIPNAQRGNLNVKVTVEKHPTFVRDRSHLRTKCSINVLELILGTDVYVTNLSGDNVKVKIPKGTNPGTILSIAGHGLPDMNTGRKGNLYLEIKGITPKIDDWDLLKKVSEINNGISTST
jgi:curved DNA-binding protein